MGKGDSAVLGIGRKDVSIYATELKLPSSLPSLSWSCMHACFRHGIIDGAYIMTCSAVFVSAELTSTAPPQVL